MSLLAGFFELGRPTALALLVLSLQLPKRSRSDSTSQITASSMWGFIVVLRDILQADLRGETHLRSGDKTFFSNRNGP